MSDASSATDYIEVSVQTIQQLFSGELLYELPWFQRSYAWQEENAARLLRDILEASESDRGRYFLGHVMLARPNKQTYAAIIDGQQRMLTLTIIFALLRDRAPSADAADRLEDLIRAGSDAQGKAIYRVTPQPAYADNFEAFVQQPDGTTRVHHDDILELLECERNFLNNRDELAKTLDEVIENTDTWHRFTEFLLERCSLVIEIVSDENEAWEMLSIEETTGLDFHSSERSKIAIVSAMPRKQHEQAGEVWDIWQARLGAVGMSKLLGHIRLLKLGKRSSKPVEQSLIELFKLNENGITFIQDTLVPRSEHYSALTVTPVAADDGSELSAIAESLIYLRWLEREPWVAPALSWLQRRGFADPDTAFVFNQLERLAWIMRIGTRDPIEQERRFLKIANAINKGEDPHTIPDFLIEKKILKPASDNLLSKTFFDKSCSRLVLRRLSRMHGADPGPINRDQATVEHVLPRRPENASGWDQEFSSKAIIDEHVHRLGNLAVLSFDDNQSAGSKGFEIKRPILANSRFALAQQVAATEKWQPKTIMDRSEKLATDLLAHWDLELIKN